MDIYRVGGAVRDRLLGLERQDSDYVVVGATAEQMLAQGFKQVGRDFPVFLHPQTGEEYALARTERKTAPGYTGFQVHAAPDVTLEQDLQRRDLTINAMAEADDGRLIDPFGGQRDLQRKVLRHVSPAFGEDPVRILRVARFAARFAPLGFSVAEDTMALMVSMVENGEVDALVAERVWAEMERALSEQQPEAFFQVLRRCGALQRLLPELDRLWGVPQRPEHHPEVDTGVHTMLVLDQAVRLSTDTRVRFAALVHDLGKGTTPAEMLPRHIGHEDRGVELIQEMCRRLRIPNDYRDLAVLVARYHGVCHRAAELRAATIHDTLAALDVFRRPERLELFLLACMADSRGRTGFENRDYPQADIFRAALAATRSVDSGAVAAQGIQGPRFGEEMRRLRIRAIRQTTQRDRPKD